MAPLKTLQAPWKHLDGSVIRRIAIRPPRENVEASFQGCVQVRQVMLPDAKRPGCLEQEPVIVRGVSRDAVKSCWGGLSPPLSLLFTSALTFQQQLQHNGATQLLHRGPLKICHSRRIRMSFSERSVYRYFFIIISVWVFVNGLKTAFTQPGQGSHTSHGYSHDASVTNRGQRGAESKQQILY